MKKLIFLFMLCSFASIRAQHKHYSHPLDEKLDLISEVDWQNLTPEHRKSVEKELAIIEKEIAREDKRNNKTLEEIEYQKELEQEWIYMQREMELEMIQEWENLENDADYDRQQDPY